MALTGDKQFEVDVEPRVPFGSALTLRVKTFTPGGFDLRTQTKDSPRGDYRMFGIDRETPPTWSWSLFTDTYTETDALALADSFAQVWDNAARYAPESVVAVRYQINGRQRRVYGRPRRMTPNVDKVHLGKIYIEADFDLSEDSYYDDSESSVTVRMGTGYTAKAGIVVPQPLPWSFTSTPAPQSYVAAIGGSQKTWITPTFYGPVTNPWVQIGSTTWGLTGNLPVGWTATVSGVPWNMGVWRQDGLTSALTMDPRSRLSALQMAPGNYTITYGGLDNTASSKVVVAWRNAWKTL